jgi:hypothetical protein
MKTTYIILALILLMSNYAKSQPSGQQNGGTFAFETYKHSKVNLYPPISQNDITAVKISIITLHSETEANRLLFFPLTHNGNNINLFDLLVWAIKDLNLPVYNPDEGDFDSPVSWTFIESSFFKMDTVLTEDPATGEIRKVLANHYSGADVKSYLLLESTIYGKNNKEIARRPLGLCPIRHEVRPEYPDTLKRKLFWVFYPDVMNLLSGHIPAKSVKGIKNINEFFTKNMYKGDYFPYYHFNSEFYTGFAFGDTSQPEINGFNVSWIHSYVKEGMYVPKHKTFFQGNPELKSGYPHTEPARPIPDASQVEFARFIYKTIDLRQTENYPLYFPETPCRGQKSLSDLILEGIQNGGISAYEPDSESSFETPLTLEMAERNMGKRTDTLIMLNFETGESHYKEVSTIIASNEIKKYIIKEVELFDKTGKSIAISPVALIPVREYSLYDDVEISESSLKAENKVCCIPFHEKGFKNILDNHFVYMFRGSDYASYSDFFNQKKYKVSHTGVKVASKKMAIAEFVFPETTAMNPEKHHFTLPEAKKGKIVLRKVLFTDTANYSLFYPEFPDNGLKNLIDLVYHQIESGYISVFEYEADGNYNKELTVAEAEEALGVEMRTVMLEDPYTGDLVTKEYKGSFNSSEIRGYIVKELHINNVVYICGISPVREVVDYESNGEVPAVYQKTSLWIPYNSKMKELLSNQERYRVSFESESSFYDYFSANKYKGNVISEREVDAEEVTAIILKLK